MDILCVRHGDPHVVQYLDLLQLWNKVGVARRPVLVRRCMPPTAPYTLLGALIAALATLTHAQRHTARKRKRKQTTSSFLTHFQPEVVVSEEQLELLSRSTPELGVFDLPKGSLTLDGIPKGRISEFLNHLNKGGFICVRDCYNSALRLHSMIQKRILNGPSAKRKLQSRRYSEAERYSMTREKMHKVAALGNRILIPAGPLRDGSSRPLRRRRRGFPDVAWVTKMLERRQYKYLKLRVFLGLNSAWERYKKGVLFPHLPPSYVIHPFYNVFCPPPHSAYVKLVAQWIEKSFQKKVYRSAVDVGTGSGVVALTLLHHGCQFVRAIDVNPFAVLSVKEDRRRMMMMISNKQDYLQEGANVQRPVENAGRNNQGRELLVESGDLLESLLNLQNRSSNSSSSSSSNSSRPELIIFNPPWVSAKHYSSSIESNKAQVGVSYENSSVMIWPSRKHLDQPNSGSSQEHQCTTRNSTSSASQSSMSPLEQAIFSQQGLIRRFLTQARKIATERVVVVYSDIASLSSQSSSARSHELEREIKAVGGYEVVDVLRIRDESNDAPSSPSSKASSRSSSCSKRLKPPGKYGNVNIIELWELRPLKD
eukprot:jgi/Bigna1/67804/fgenesh1_pg.4_\